MKSVVIEKPGVLRIAERERPQPGTGEVRVKVVAAGICGSDVHIFHGNNPFARYPRVIGHEFSGIIDAVGEGVDPARIGTRVAVDPVVSCGHCYPCSIGKPNVCTTLQVIGVHLDGGFSEYAVAPSRNAYPLPDCIGDDVAPMIEPFTIAANICGHLKPKPDDIALIYGAGPMGLTVIQALKGVYGVKQVIVADRLPSRLKLAGASGADLLIDSSVTPLPEELTRLQIKPTLIVDAACHPAILQEAALLASPAARIGLMGFSAEPSSITQQSLTSKELSIFTSRLNSARFPEVIGWFERGQVQPATLITHAFDLEEVEKGLHLFEHDAAACCKVVLRF